AAGDRDGDRSGESDRDREFERDRVVANPAAPSNTVAPTISGTAQDGQTLTVASNGTWTSPDVLTYSFQWQRSSDGGSTWSNVSGATSSSYALTSADVAKKLRVVVTATDQESQTGTANSSASSTVANPAAPSNTVAPTISGTAQDGQTLTVASNGTWTSPDTLSYSYQWQRSSDGGSTWSNVSGATTSTYALTSADVAKKLRVVVTATDQESQTGTANSSATASVANPAAPSNTVAPTISGTAQDGQTLTVASNGTWTSPDTLSYSYQWQRSSDGGSTWANVSAATGSTYALTSADVGKKLRVVVTATDQESQTGTANSSASASVSNPAAPSNTVAPAISGTAQDGQTLSTSTGTWTSPDTLSYSYQWQRSSDGGSTWSNISGATSSSYAATST